MKGTIIFDFDGVILDSFKVAFDVLSMLHKKYNLPPLTEEKLQELFEGNIWKGYEALGIIDNLVTDFRTDFKDLFGKKHSELNFFQGMKECITSISSEFNLMIISSNHSETIKQMLDAESLTNHFDKVFGAEVSGTKREKITAYILEHKLDKNKIFFISDTAGDIREVEGLGIHSIAVSWGYHSRERLEASKPDVIVHSPTELKDYFLKING
jgi:phosphoglycolate phosphatase